MVLQTLLRETYQGKKVLLTGHTGFKGSWLLTWLQRIGADVTGYSLPPDDNHRLYDDIKGSSMCRSIFADIRDRDRVSSEILALKPDFIFHLAAQPLVRLSYEQPLETIDTNVMGTAYVLDAMRRLTNKCSAVIITTDKVYENHEDGRHYSERDPLGGYDPYSASKAACEIVISSYRNSFFNPATYSDHHKAIGSARAGNVIGGGDWAKDRIIPDLVRAFIANQKGFVRNPSSVRPWQHVVEPLAGYLLLGARLDREPTKFASAWNFGPLADDMLNVRGLAEIAMKHWPSANIEFASQSTGPHEATLLQLDITQAQRQLEWQPKYRAQEAIRRTIDWYFRVAVGGEDPRKLIEEQIDDYTR